MEHNSASPLELRAKIRTEAIQGHTAGMADGFLQANLVILPKADASDFVHYCRLNPKPCPLVGMTETGNPYFDSLGRDFDIRTDVPGYNVYRDGKFDRSVLDLKDLWQDDFVCFALGCSFTFEHALLNAGIPMWHIENDTTVPMFKTSIETAPSGPFGGGMVVSMRAIPDDRIAETVEICGRFPEAHGEPVHIGAPGDIGIEDMSKPDWGDPLPIGENQTPVFWACGVTPQSALLNASLPLAITHKPGRMLVTDIPNDKAAIMSIGQDFSLAS